MAEIAARQDFRSMMQDGKFKVMQGWTTPEEVIKAVYTQAIDSSQCPVALPYFYRGQRVTPEQT